MFSSGEDYLCPQHFRVVEEAIFCVSHRRILVLSMIKLRLIQDTFSIVITSLRAGVNSVCVARGIGYGNNFGIRQRGVGACRQVCRVASLGWEEVGVRGARACLALARDFLW
jgi:hypothetical protein